MDLALLIQELMLELADLADLALLILPIVLLALQSLATSIKLF